MPEEMFIGGVKRDQSAKADECKNGEMLFHPFFCLLSKGAHNPGNDEVAKCAGHRTGCNKDAKTNGNSAAHNCHDLIRKGRKSRAKHPKRAMLINALAEHIHAFSFPEPI